MTDPVARLKAMQIMALAELAHREAQRSTDPKRVEAVIQQLNNASAILTEQKLENRAAHMLKLAKGLQKQLRHLKKL